MEGHVLKKISAEKLADIEQKRETSGWILKESSIIYKSPYHLFAYQYLFRKLGSPNWKKPDAQFSSWGYLLDFGDAQISVYDDDCFWYIGSLTLVPHPRAEPSLPMRIKQLQYAMRVWKDIRDHLNRQKLPVSYLQPNINEAYQQLSLSSPTAVALGSLTAEKNPA